MTRLARQPAHSFEPRIPSGVGHGAMRARPESPRASYATSGFRIGTTRVSRRRQLPTKQHAALLFGATRAYQPDSSSKPPHRQPCAGVLGKSSTPTENYSDDHIDQEIEDAVTNGLTAGPSISASAGSSDDRRDRAPIHPASRRRTA